MSEQPQNEKNENEKLPESNVDESLYEEFVDEKEEKKNKNKKRFSALSLVILAVCVAVFIYSMSNILKLTPNDFTTAADTDSFRQERLEYEEKQKEASQSEEKQEASSSGDETSSDTESSGSLRANLKKRLVFDETDGAVSFLAADIDAYVQKNADTVGWLKISDSTGKVSGLPIDIPVVRTVDNDFYLDHNFYKEENINGWVFMDYENVCELVTDNPNTILYGHARSDNMFGGLKYLNEKTKWYSDPENHYIYLKTATEDTVWQIFSWYEASVSEEMASAYYYYRTDFPSDEFFVEFCNLMQEKNTIEGFEKFEFTPESRILTLQTCKSYDDDIRVVVHAKLVKLQVWESEE